MTRILIVDDETPARNKVKRFLCRLDSEMEITEAATGEEAVERLKKASFDILFLDIQMPGMNGFEVVDEMGPPMLPPTIFATAFNEYAVAAFEAEAVDYLLKPFTFDRFQTAYERALRKGTEASQARALKKLLELVRPENRPSHLAVRAGSAIKMIDPKDIYFIRADNHYLHIQLSGESYYERKSLQEMENLLDPHSFVRIHRSTLVNLNQIRELHPRTHGDYTVILNDGSELVLSRRYRERLPL